MESVKQNSGVVKWIAAGAFAALLVAGGLLVQRVSQLEAALDGQREASEKQLEAIKETAASSATAMHRTVEELNQQVAESNKSAAASAQRAASIAQRNAEKMVAQLRAAGVRFVDEPCAPALNGINHKFVCFLDPDGTVVEAMEFFK